MVPARTRVLITLSAAILAALAATASAQNLSHTRKLDLALREAAQRPPEPQRVIIRTNPGRSQALRDALIAHGDAVEAEHPSLDLMTAYVHGEDLVALNDDPSVVSVSCDCQVGLGETANLTGQRQGQGGPRDDGSGSASDLRQILGLDQGPVPAPRGRDIDIAILDSGIEPSRDFSGRVMGFWDYTRGGGRTAPYHDYGHGTHVAGLIAGSGSLSGGRYVGVAPEASLFIFKVLDGTGTGRTSSVIRALEYITANRKKLHIEVINLSLGHPVMEPAATDPLVRAVNAAVRAGMIVVVSAGNNGTNPQTNRTGYAGINSPGNSPSAITAGAADTKGTVRRRDDRVAPFSSRGPTWYDGYAKPDVVAPGVNLVADLPPGSALWVQNPEIRVDSHYARLSGTSMAAAVATGVVALTVEAHRTASLDRRRLTPNAVKALVEYTATPLRDGARDYDSLTQGTGEVNGEGAVRLASGVDASEPIGEFWTAGVEAFSLFGGVKTLWAENIVWGSFVVDGGVALVNSVAWDENIVWGTEFERDGDNIVWGTVRLADGFGDGDNIVWGTMDFDSRGEDNIVWGTAIVDEWADNIVWGTGLIGYRDGENIVWGTSGGDDNIVWGTVPEENIVWGTVFDEGGENIVWGSARAADADNIVWGSAHGGGGDNIVWGSARGGDDNIVWGSARGIDDNIVWGTKASARNKN